MDLLLLILITLQITKISPRKYASSSDESIENLLYYKDCQHKKKEEPTVTPTLLRGPEIPRNREPDCPFPRMCCALSCGNECGNQSPFSGRNMEPIQQNFLKPIPAPPRQPPISVQTTQKGKKKKIKPQVKIPPIGGRRDFGFTKEKIKSLISQDEDIRKILKDLVRVTMQKVDLLDMINGKRSDVKKPKSEASDSEEDY